MLPISTFINMFVKSSQSSRSFYSRKAKLWQLDWFFWSWRHSSNKASTLLLFSLSLKMKTEEAFWMRGKTSRTSPILQLQPYINRSVQSQYNHVTFLSWYSPRTVLLTIIGCPSFFLPNLYNILRNKWNFFIVVYHLYFGVKHEFSLKEIVSLSRYSSLYSSLVPIMLSRTVYERIYIKCAIWHINIQYAVKRVPLNTSFLEEVFSPDL